MLWQGNSFALPDIPSFSGCPDIIHNSGFQDHSQASLGAGGTHPYNGAQTVMINNSEYTFYLYVPSQYSPSKAMPVVALLPAQAVAGENQAVAELTHNSWTSTAEMYQFITVTQVTTHPNGGWSIPFDGLVLEEVLNQVHAEYNIEQSRRYLWGFSAGAHVGLALVLEESEYFAALAINAGALSQFAGTSAPFGAARQAAIFSSIGDSDPLYPDALNDQNAFINAGWVAFEDYQLDVFSGGHVWPSDADEKAADFLCDKSIYD